LEQSRVIFAQAESVTIEELGLMMAGEKRAPQETTAA